MEAIVAIVGVVGILLLILAYGAFSWGYVTFKFWYWFLLPVFPQMPHITFWQAVGLMMFISLFQNHSSDSIKDEYKDKNSGAIVSIIAPWLTWLVGYIIWCWIN